MANDVKLLERVLDALSRDFRNVYLVNLDQGDLSVLKLDGYLTQGLSFDPSRRFPYAKSCDRYIRDRVHPDDQSMMLDALSATTVRTELAHRDEYIGTYRVLEKGETHFYQYKYVKIDGTSEVIAGFQNVDAVVAVERKRQDELSRLLEQDQFRKNVFGSLARIYFCVYYIDLATGRFSEMGQTEVEVIKSYIGKEGDAREKFRVTCEQLVVPEQTEMLMEFTNIDTLADRLMGRDSIGVHFKGIYVDWCEGLFVPVERDAGGRCTKVLWVLRSIKDEMAREEAYKEQLRMALQKAEQASVAKSSFLTRMSHDIRTPLNGILGIFDLVDKKNLDPKTHGEYRQKARVAANHLLSLLNDVLEMSKLEDSDTELAEEPFNLYELVSDVYTIANLRAVENCVTVDHDCGSSLKYLDLFGSPLHVRQIFLNLLTNAIKYNKNGGSVFCHSELVEESDDKVVYCFHVDDTGIGMSEDFLEHIFDPFSQERNDARSKFQGTGMGMAIVKSLVEKMHGSIAVESEVGFGSRFAVTIPFRINHNPQKKPEIDYESVSLYGMKVLLVEDNELNLDVARNLLEDMGVSVTCATNGGEAVEVFERMDEGSLDLILMDLMMPVLDGYGATKKIRLSSKKDGSQIPIVALSANAFAEDVRKSREAGMNDHLSKPLNVPQLKQVLAKFKK